MYAWFAEPYTLAQTCPPTNKIGWWVVGADWPTFDRFIEPKDLRFTVRLGTEYRLETGFSFVPLVAVIYCFRTRLLFLRRN